MAVGVAIGLTDGVVRDAEQPGAKGIGVVADGEPVDAGERGGKDLAGRVFGGVPVTQAVEAELEDGIEMPVEEDSERGRIARRIGRQIGVGYVRVDDGSLCCFAFQQRQPPHWASFDTIDVQVFLQS